MRFLLILAIIAACDSNLKVKVTSNAETNCSTTEAGCDAKFADSKLRLTNQELITNGLDLDVNWTLENGSAGSSQFHAYLAATSECQDEKVTAEVAAALSAKLSQIPEGTYYLCLSASQGKQTIHAANNGIKMIFDRTPPSIESLSTLYKNAPFTLAPKIADANAFNVQWLKASGAGDVFFTITDSAAVTVSTEGFYDLIATASDAAGNVSQETFHVVYDTTPPIVNAGPDVAKNAAFSMSATVTDGETIQWSQVSGPGTLTFADRASLTSGVTASADGTYVLRLTATDASGNSAIDEFTLTWITTGPVFTSLLHSGIAADGYINDSEKTATSSLFTLNAAAYDAVEYSGFLTTPATCDGTTTYGQALPPVATDMPTDGDYAVCVHLSDLAGNHVYGTSATITRDIQYPSVVSFNRAHEASDGYVNSAESTSTYPMLSFTGSNYASVSYSTPLANASLTCDASKTYGATSIPTINTIPQVNGAYAVCAKLVDAAGNVAYDISAQVVLDLTAPSVNAGADITASSPASINATTSGASFWQWSKVSGPGGITFGSATAEDTTALASAEGSYVLRLTATDDAGNSAHDEINFTWDTTPPVFTSLVLANEASNGYINAAESSASNPLWTLTASGQTTTNYTVPMMDAAGTLVCDVSKTYDQTSIPKAMDIPAIDNSYVICARLSDAAGNIVYGKSASVVRDTVPPQFTSMLGANEASDGYINSADAGSNNALFSVSANNYDADDYTTVLADSALICDSSKNYNQSDIPLINTTPGIDGAYAVCVKLSDAAGNAAYGKSQSIIRDATAPTVNVGSDVISNASASLTPTTSGGISFAWTKQSGPGSIVFGSASAENTTASASVEGTYTLRLTVTDIAGNSAFDELNYSYDTTPPTFTSLVKTADAADGYVNNAEKNGSTALWTLTASGYAAIAYTGVIDDTTPVTCNGLQIYSQSTIPTASNLPAIDSVYSVCVRLTDSANNITYGKAEVIARDTTAPTVNVGTDLTTNALVTVNASVSGASSYQWTKQSGSGAITFSAATAVSTDVSANVDDTYVIRLTATDSAGNSAYDELNMIWDATAPTFTSLIKTGAGSDGYINNAESSGNTAIWALTASGYSVVSYSAPLDDTTPVTCNGAISYGVSTIAHAVDLPNSDAPYIICVNLSDAAGNHAYGKSQVIVRDIVAPTVNVGSDITLNTAANASATVSGATTLLWTKQSGSGNINFSASNAASTTITADTEATYVIRLTASDAAGNSAFDELTYTYNTSVPSLTSFAAANAASDGYVNNAEKNSASALLALNASNYVTVDYTVVLVDSSLTCDASKTYDQSSIPIISSMPAPDGLYAVCVKLVASGGGTTYGKSQSIVKDTTAPSVNAGADLTAGAAAANINATTSGATTWLWTKQSGSGSVTFGSSNAEDTTASTGAEDTYTLRLTATDAAGNSAFDEMLLTWDITPPSFTSLALANEAIGGYLGSAELSATNPLWTLTASGHTSADYTSPLDDTGSAVVCNGAKTYDQTSIAAAINIPAADKPYVICVKLVDAAGNIAYGKSAAVTRDTVAPVFTSLNGANGASDGYINSSEAGSASAMFALVASGHTADDFTVVLADSALTCDGSKTYSQANIPLINTTPGADGAYAVCVKLTDVAGNITYGKSQSITRDTNAPTVNVGSDITSNAAANITPTTSGGSTYAWTKQSGSGSITFGSPSAANTNATASAESTYTLRLTVTDVAGNSAYDELDYVYDTTPPTFTSLARANEGSDTYVNSAEASASNPLWTLTASGQSTTNYTTALDDTGSAVTCDAGKTYSQSTIAAATNLPASDKPYVICVKLVDAAGNITYGKSLSITRDTTPPTLTSFNGANGASDGYINTSETGSASAMFALVASGHTADDFTVVLADSALTCDGSKTYSQANIPLINTTPGADGAYAVCVKLTDVAGNITYGKSQSITRDTNAPTINVGSDITSNAAANITPTTSGGSTYAWTKQSGSGTITFGSPAAANTTATASAEGTYTLRLTVTDVAGNSIYDELDYTYDTTPPTFTSLVVANEASDGYVNSAEASASNPLWTLTASGQSTTNYTTALDDTGSAVTCDAGKTYSQSTIAAATNLPASDKPYVICVKLADVAGNITYGKSAQVIRDTAAPTITSFNGANAASDGYINASETGSTAAIAALVASGQSTTNFTVILSNTSLTCDVSKTYSQSSIPLINTMTATDGAYAVCVKLVDVAGNITYGKSQVITRDVAPPTVNVGADVWAKASYSINATTSGASTYTWTKQSGPGLVTFGSGSAEDTTASSDAQGLHVLRLTVADAAGNTANDELNFTWDTVAPSFSSLALANEAVDLYLNQADITANNAVTGSVVGSGYDDVIYQVFSSATTCSAATYTNSANVIPLAGTLSALASGTYKVCVKMTDLANNTPAYGNSSTFTIDQTAPTAASTLYTANVANSTLTLNWTAGSDDVSAAANLVYSVYYSTSSSFDTVAQVEGGTLITSGTNITTAAPSGLARGTTYYFNVIVRDQAGNKTAATKVTEKTRDASFVEVDIGYDSACALTVEGKIYCWGYNANGQLGNGTTTTSNIPIAISSSLRFRTLATGHNHACALTEDGLAYCWGLNSSGQLGTGDTTSSTTPVAVSSTDRFKQLIAGSTHTCAIRIDGAAYCWGSKSQGRVGDGTSSGTATFPVAVSGGLKFRKLGNYYNSNCGVTDGGDAYCWGINGEGQLGDGTISDRYVPTLVIGSHKFRDIAAGYTHSCGVRSDGQIYCWGYDDYGKLGNGGANTNTTSPGATSGARIYRSVAVGSYSACGLEDSGDIYCWGRATANGTASDQSAPVKLTSSKKYRYLASSSDAYCAITSEGDINCWGVNTSGKLGNGNSTSSASPVALNMQNVTGDSGWLKMAGGLYNICGLRSTGKIYCWGSNSSGQVGDGTSTGRASATLVYSTENFIDVAVANAVACGLRDNGQLTCWGTRLNGRLGDNTNSGYSTTPVNLTTSVNFTQISGGSGTTSAISGAGQLYGWGVAANIGNGSSFGDVLVPSLADATTKFIAVSAGIQHGCGIVDDGTVKCWGNNLDGQLGTGDGMGYYSPTAVTGSNKFLTIGAGDRHTCGLNSAGQAMCWGDDAYGALGDDATLADKLSPTLVDSGNTYIDVRALYQNSCGIRANGTLYCWGRNSLGTVGDDTSGTNRTTPVAVNLSKTFRVGTLGGNNALAGATTDGWAYAWGYDGNLQVGDGNIPTAYVLSPTPILRKVTLVLQGVSSTNVGAGSNLVDGNLSTAWGGAGTSAWVEVTISNRTTTVKKVQMKLAALTNTYTHTIFAGPTAAPSSQKWTTTLNHGDGTWVEAIINSGAVDTRYLRLQSSSPSDWPGWYEIEVFE